MVNALVLWVPVLMVLAWLGTKGPVGFLLSNALLLVLFLFSLAAIDERQGIFYSIIALGVMVFSILQFVMPAQEGFSLLGRPLGGPAAFLGILVAGFGLAWLVRGLAGPGNAGAVIGVPQTLAVSGSFINFMSPTLISALGYLENRFWFGIINLTNMMLALTPLAFIAGAFYQVLPILVASGSFALFHLSVFALPGLLFAFFAFLIFSLSRAVVGPEPANVAHYVHNGAQTLPGALTVV